MFVALTTQQLLYLNVLVNSGALCTDEYQTAGAFAAQLLKEEAGPKERVILQKILADDRLRNVRIVRADCEDWGAGYCAFADGNGELVLAFRGTTSGPEWYDNFSGANRADSPHQLAARAYLDGLDLSGWENVTVTGHSKGGNKAMYCATVSDKVDRCVSFDGQGFSDEFMEKYAYRIADQQGRIENHCAGGDYINVLLNGIGERVYYETFNPSNDFFLNHELSAMCDANGRMQPGAQQAEAQEFAAFANACLRTLPASRRDSTLDYLGKMAALVLKGDTATAGAEDLSALIHQRRYRRELTWLLGYVIRYERETGVPINALRGIIENQNISAAFQGIGERLLDLLEWQAKNPLAAWGVASGINFLVEDAAWSYILEVISDAAWLSARIVIDYDSQPSEYASA